MTERTVWYETAPLYRAVDGHLFVYIGPLKRKPFPERYHVLRALIGSPCRLCDQPLEEPHPDCQWSSLLPMEPNGRQILAHEVGMKFYAHAACTRPISRAGLPLPVADLTIADLVLRIEAIEARLVSL